MLTQSNHQQTLTNWESQKLTTLEKKQVKMWRAAGWSSLEYLKFQSEQWSRWTRMNPAILAWLWAVNHHIRIITCRKKRFLPCIRSKLSASCAIIKPAGRPLRREFWSNQRCSLESSPSIQLSLTTSTRFVSNSNSHLCRQAVGRRPGSKRASLTRRSPTVLHETQPIFLRKRSSGWPKFKNLEALQINQNLTEL